MIEMIDVYKSYPNGVNALNGINIKIEPGEFVYIVGPSGSGKTTFIKMMYREEKPTSGAVLINGKDVASYKNSKIPLLRRNMGVIFQDYKLLTNLNVYENVAYSLLVTEETRTRMKRRVMDVLELVGLKHKIRMKPQELSGGEQQRVSIARSIVRNPKLVIADEPTGNLDPETSIGILKLFEEINALGTTIVMATHNKDLVNNFRHRVIAIENGEIVRDEVKGEYGYDI
ncbi:MAG: ftsE [Bacillales bacterium]|jgi:cell division transport system ATP-binding protein|nr:ftsE [Bacillales bacterium]